MTEDLGPRSVVPDITREALSETFPDLFGGDPYRCAACGEYIHSDIEGVEDIDDINSIDPDKLPWPVELPPETVQLMENNQEVTISQDTESIRLQFCKHHVNSLRDWIGKPGTVVFSSFDARYAVEVTKDRPFSRDKWKQSKLRVAREIVRGKDDVIDSEIDEDVRRLGATLLVASVDEYNLDYGPVEKAKETLAGRLSKRGLQVSFPDHGFIDIQIEAPGTSKTIYGSVFLLPSEQSSYQNTPISKYEADPERSVSGTLYYSLHRNSFYEPTYKEFENCIHVGFYKIPGEKSWIWYPFEENRSEEFSSNDRRFLTVMGPTGSSPMLSLEEFETEYLDVQQYESRVEENWEVIDQERSATNKARDFLRRYLE